MRLNNGPVILQMNALVALNLLDVGFISLLHTYVIYTMSIYSSESFYLGSL